MLTHIFLAEHLNRQPLHAPGSFPSCLGTARVPLFSLRTRSSLAITRLRLWTAVSKPSCTQIYGACRMQFLLRVAIIEYPPLDEASCIAPVLKSGEVDPKGSNRT